MEKFYITTTLPYVNAEPHMGHALEFVQADAIARYKRQMGYDVFFNTGTDEHGQKIFEKAREAGEEPQAYTDRMAERFRALLRRLNIGEHNFVRTTDRAHKKAAQAFWRACAANGDIYKKNYKTKYCVGCELEKTDSDLDRGVCPEHPTLSIEVREEENYFFKFSRYQEKLIALYEERPHFVIAESRQNEAEAFIRRGLEDFSISRLREKMPWGVPVPDDDKHVMYVWFDALVNYISAIGWPHDMEQFRAWWPVTQIAGKDNLRQQAAMWQAMLMSAGIEPSRQIVIHGFLTSGGRKMSKTLGNVINPQEIIEEYGTDALRYFLLREVSTFEDSDITTERFREAYNANLANGLGNLVSRIMKMASTYLKNTPSRGAHSIPDEYEDALGAFELQRAADIVWKKIGLLDEYIQKTEPYRTVKTDPQKSAKDLGHVLGELITITLMLKPILPETAERIQMLIQENKMPEQPLFARKL